jgi:hypothetical protein
MDWPVATADCGNDVKDEGRRRRLAPAGRRRTEDGAGTLHLPDGQRLFVVRTGETPTGAQAETPFGSEELFA